MKLNLLIILLLFVTSGFAQQERKFVRKGNKVYESEKYADSEILYQKGLEKKGEFVEGIYNLGNAIYKQDRLEDARTQYELTTKMTDNKSARAKAFHNMGNTYLDEEKYEEGVNAYKQALKLNPKDLETKYNLAYANEMLRQQNGGSGSDNQDQQEKDQDQDQEQDQQEQQQNQEQEQEQDQQEQQQQPKDQLSKEEAERLLQALENEEQKLQEELQKKKNKTIQVTIEKDW